MRYLKEVPYWLVPFSERGRDDTCLICQLGLHHATDELLRKAATPQYILQRLKFKYPKQYKVVRCLNKMDVKYHLSHSEVSFDQYKLAKEARRMLEKEQVSAEKVNEKIMGNIAMAIGLVSELDPEELNKLSPKEKFELFERATKLLQGEKKIALQANKENRESSEWMNKMNNLASGGNNGPKNLGSSESN